MSDHHVSFKDLPAGGEKFEPAKASKLVSFFGGLGALGIIGSIYYFSNAAARPAFTYSWLFAIFFGFTFVAGGCFWILLHNASNSSWGVVIRRLFENLAMLAIPLGILASPLLFKPVNEHLYEWMNFHRTAAEHAHHDHTTVAEALHHMADSNPHIHPLVEKFGYLKISDHFSIASSWQVRFVLYFVILGFLAFVLRKKFLKQEQDGSIKHTINARQFACVMLFPYALTVTFAAVDWLMTLDYTWFSTMWGVYIFAGCAWSSMALMLLLVSYLRGLGYLQKVVTMEHYHLMGKLLFAFTVFWAYIAFSQYFLIWYANIPEETRFYFIRNTEGWRLLSIFIVVGHFVAPFVLLLSQPKKKNPKFICATALWVLFMHMVDIYWNIIPERGPSLGIGVLAPNAWFGDVVALCAVIGTLGYLYLRSLGKHSLYAWRDPRLIESVNVKN
jgi:hypothetical protein